MNIDEQRIFVCEKLFGWKEHVQGELFGQMIDVQEQDTLVCKHLPLLTLDWLHDCVRRCHRRTTPRRTRGNAWRESMKRICRECGEPFLDDPQYHLCPKCEETLHSLTEHPQSEWKEETANDDKANPNPE